MVQFGRGGSTFKSVGKHFLKRVLMGLLCHEGEVTEPVIAVLIPCYNEAVTIRTVVGDFQRELSNAAIYLRQQRLDETARIAREAGAVVVHEKRQGKGNVIQSMFQSIDDG
jgi:hypothetical protein